MKFAIYLLLLALSAFSFGQDTISQDLSKEPGQEPKNPTPRSPFKGNGLDGSGHCAGQLLIKPNMLTWDIVNSECHDVPYKTLEFTQHKYDLHAVYLLKTHNPKCKFKVLVLDYAAPPDGKQRGFEWNMTGYISWRSYKKNDLTDQLSCNLY
jgi:hypothetical protein